MNSAMRGSKQTQLPWTQLQRTCKCGYLIKSRTTALEKNIYKIINKITAGPNQRFPDRRHNGLVVVAISILLAVGRRRFWLHRCHFGTGKAWEKLIPAAQGPGDLSCVSAFTWDSSAKNNKQD